MRNFSGWKSQGTRSSGFYRVRQEAESHQHLRTKLITRRGVTQGCTVTHFYISVISFTWSCWISCQGMPLVATAKKENSGICGFPDSKKNIFKKYMTESPKARGMYIWPFKLANWSKILEILWIHNTFTT